jgi:hypothetical protein
MHTKEHESAEARPEVVEDNTASGAFVRRCFPGELDRSLFMRIRVLSWLN